MFWVSVYEGQDYGGFLLSKSCHFCAAVWWHVAEYLGCRNINRWGEHAKRVNASRALVINLFNPSSPHLPGPNRASHWAHCSPKPDCTALLRVSTDLLLCQLLVRKKSLRKECIQFNCWDINDPPLLPPRLLLPLVSLCSYLSLWKEVTQVKDQLSEKHHQGRV